jgi:hypothetical protein
MRITLIVLAVVLAVSPVSAAAQRRQTPAGPFAKIRGLDCTFTNYGAAAWDGTSARIVTGDDNVTFRIEEFDYRRGVAMVTSAAAKVPVSATLAETGLNVIEHTPIGNFILTTVFVAGGSADKYVAVHSRHLGDTTTAPSVSQYFGTCEVVN